MYLQKKVLAFPLLIIMFLTSCGTTGVVTETVVVTITRRPAAATSTIVTNTATADTSATPSVISVTPSVPSPSPSPTIPTTSELPTTQEPTHTPLPQNTVVLTSHREGQTVPCEDVIKGTHTLNNGERIWVVVRIGGRYYPQAPGGEYTTVQNDTWFSRVRFGDCGNPEVDKGKTFELLVVSANERANTEFENYISRELNDNHYGGLSRIPQEGVTIHKLLKVLRE
jgi:hypothetical protein